MPDNLSDQACPLCNSNDLFVFHNESKPGASGREYLRCNQCALVFVPSYQFISPEQEKAEYDLHQNHPGDQGYRRFLGRLFVPLNEKLKPGVCGLDFGSGPGPTLSLMFEEAGYAMKIYDAFYADDTVVLQQPYDFITATETVEHLHHPRRELDRLWTILKPGGYLGIMTKLVIDRDAFANWHYKNDLTHVCFFSTDTFHWLSALWNAKVEFVGSDVILLQKPGGD
ncbi:class I SAM-dependent methyltransferase [Kaarinaea lacus]